MAPGYFWIDDVSLEQVGDEVPLTEAPVLDTEEAPIAPPGEIVRTAVRCSECGYRNNPDGGTCYACGTALAPRTPVVEGPAVKPIASFEDSNPMSGGTVVGVHASQGPKSLRLDRSYVSLDEPQDWLGYDFLKADLYTEARKPLDLYVEIRDAATRDYWTRVNYSTVVPPGQSTLVIPIKQLYVGEKSRPGRMVDLGHITRLVLGIGDAPAAPLYLDNLRLERDDSPSRVVFEGLHAFDFGTGISPVMEAFTPITPSTLYSQGRGYGLKNARIWRAFDALQPDPLYQDFLCIEAGGLAVDLPNGKYRVFVNIDSPSGFWGEYQTYRKRAIFAEGQPVVSETMDFEAFRKQYFRFWNVEDLPADNTFDKYQKAYYHEKQFDVEVTDGQLNLDFQGENWACCVSAVVIFPVEKADQGETFLHYMEAKRRFYFENYFKRVLPAPTGDPIGANARDLPFVVFQRDPMRDVSYNDTPFKPELAGVIRGSAFAGEFEPVTVGVVPLSDLGKVTLSVGDLQGPAATIPARMIDVGYVSYRISRVTCRGIRLHDQSAFDPAGWNRGDAQESDAAVLADGLATAQYPARKLPGDDFDPRGGRPKLAGTSRIPGSRRDARPGRYSRRPVWPRDWHSLVPGRPQGRKVQPADGRAEPAANARLRLHRLYRLAVDFVPRIRQRETDPGLHHG